jgi:hypothetical protein
MPISDIPFDCHINVSHSMKHCCQRDVITRNEEGGVVFMHCGGVGGSVINAVLRCVAARVV